MNTNRTTTFLTANLGSDIAQLFAHLERGEKMLAEAAAKRARGIVDELLTHKELGDGAEEVRRIGTVIDDALSLRRLSVRKNDMEEYFLPFALQTLKKTHVH